MKRCCTTWAVWASIWLTVAAQAQSPAGTVPPPVGAAPLQRGWVSTAWRSPSSSAPLNQPRPGQPGTSRHEGNDGASRLTFQMDSQQVSYNFGNIFTVQESDQVTSVSMTLETSAAVAMKLSFPAGTVLDPNWRTTGRVLGALAAVDGQPTQGPQQPMDVQFLLGRNEGAPLPPDNADIATSTFEYRFAPGVYALRLQITVFPSPAQLAGRYQLVPRIDFAPLAPETDTRQVTAFPQGGRLWQQPRGAQPSGSR